MRKSKPGLPRLFADALAMSMQAQTVIAMRLTKIALGGLDARHESKLMVTEKVEAAAEATMQAALSVAAGQPHRAAGRAMAVYRKRVDRNLRRLTRG